MPADAYAAAPGTRSKHDHEWAFIPYFVVIAAGIALLIGLDLWDGQVFNLDTDDILRAMQVRQLVDGQPWFDHAIAGIAMPDAYQSPWSRLVDLPYALIALALSPIAGLAHGLAIAFKIWPPMMAGLFALLVTAFLKQIAPTERQLPLPVLGGMPILMLPGIWEFSPGRIDHHNVQILLLAAAAYGASRFDRIGGTLLGASVALSLAIGLETLPVLALALGALILLWSFDVAGARRMLASVGWACLIATPLLFVLLVPPSQYWTSHSDTFSSPYALALTGFGLISIVLTVVPPPTPARRLGAALAGGLALVSIILMQFPALIHGPFAMIDGLAYRYWFGRIDQERSALVFFQTGNSAALFLLWAMFAIIAFAARPALANVRIRPGLAAVWALALGAFLLAIVSSRFSRIALTLVPLLMPLAVTSGRELWRSGYRKRAFLAAAVSFLVVLTPLAIKPVARTYDAFDYLLINRCEDQDFSILDQVGTARLMTPPALGLEILQLQKPRITVSSIPFHRAAPAMSRFVRAFMTGNARERALLLSDFDYVAICRAPQDLPGEAGLPLLKALMSGKKVEQLEPVTGSRPSRMMLFRIVHDDPELAFAERAVAQNFGQ